jgi:hypothetical protein
MNLINYCDDILKMVIPEYLKPRKGMRFFQVDRRRNKSPDLLNLAVDLFQNDEDRAEMLRNSMRTARGNDWMDVQQCIVMQGATDYLKDGFELLGTATNTVTDDVTHTYNILFRIKNMNIYVAILGTGDIACFYSKCKSIICSINIIKEMGG